jgi:pyrimidine-nucleoside phosphorylase
MKTLDDAKMLAEAMVNIGGMAGKRTVAVISSMEQPLGFAVGNILEVKEAIAALNGKGPVYLMEECYTLGAWMLVLGGKASDEDEARAALQNSIASGAALAKFREMVEAQDGDFSYIEQPEKFPKASIVEEAAAEKPGYIHSINTEGVGMASMSLGAGRMKKEDPIDYSAGIMLNKKIGDKVEKGEALAWLHTNDKSRLAGAKETFLQSYRIAEEPCAAPVLIGAVIK